MCFIISPNARRRRVVKQPIEAKKWYLVRVVPVTPTMVILEFISPIQRYRYYTIQVDSDELYTPLKYEWGEHEMWKYDLRPTDKGEIYEGFHADVGIAERGAFSDNLMTKVAYMEFPIIIPKGAHYYVNLNSNEIVCDRFKVNTDKFYTYALMMQRHRPDSAKNGIILGSRGKIAKTIDIAIRALAFATLNNVSYENSLKKLNEQEENGDVGSTKG